MSLVVASFLFASSRCPLPCLFCGVLRFVALPLLRPFSGAFHVGCFPPSRASRGGKGVLWRVIGSVAAASLRFSFFGAPFRKSPGAEKGCCSRVSGCVAAASLRCLLPSWLPGCLRPVGKVLPERKKGSCAATTTLRRSVAFVPLERSARRKGALLPFRDVFLFAVSFSGGTVCEPPRAERTVAASGVRKCFHCSPSPPPLLLRPSGEPSRAEKGGCDGVAVRLRALSVVGSVPCRSRPRRAVGAVCSNLDPSPCRARKRGRCGGRGSEAFPLLPFAASPSSPSRRTSPGGKGVLRRGSCAVGLRLFSVAAPCLLPELLYGLKGDCFAAFAGWVQKSSLLLSEALIGAENGFCRR